MLIANPIWKYFDTRTSFICDRGYTGHSLPRNFGEHLEEFELINMNGRVYDQYVGMFLSPDPFVQEPGNALNYNRYSYVLNNPLKYTDPSGYLMQSVADFSFQTVTLWGDVIEWIGDDGAGGGSMFDRNTNYVASTAVDIHGTIVDARTDGDHNVYLVMNALDLENYRNGNRSGLAVAGWTADPGAFTDMIGENILHAGAQAHLSSKGGGWVTTSAGLMKALAEIVVKPLDNRDKSNQYIIGYIEVNETMYINGYKREIVLDNKATATLLSGLSDIETTISAIYLFLPEKKITKAMAALNILKSWNIDKLYDAYTMDGNNMGITIFEHTKIIPMAQSETHYIELYLNSNGQRIGMHNY